MSRKNKLYQKAKASPKNLKFKELCLLATYAGFKFRRQPGGHHIYRHSIYKQMDMLNFQPAKDDSSKAKPYQVKQLVNYIDEYGLLKD
jgi:predicted RNA binding protein YcfA (HicA-like mRNA interferase family)